METIKTTNYDIVIDNNIFNDIETYLNNHTNGRIHIITDSKVYKLYSETIKKNLATIDYTLSIIEHGEQSKSLLTFQDTLSKLIKKNIKRNDLLVALGGGVIGDLTGFISATLYRGIPYVQIPTTLLSMVDSSIGRKTGINLKEGKNLLGAFNNPQAVYIDPEFLKTLSKRQVKSGLAEVYKAALIGDKGLLDLLKADKLNKEVIKRAINVKKTIVENDPYEKGERMKLNFGHTFAHAIEKAHHYETYTHGEAVSEGIIMALEIGVKMQITPKYLYDEIKQLFIEKGLVTEPLLEYQDYLSHVTHDKKSTSAGLNFIFLKDYEQPHIQTINVGDL